MSTHFSQNLRYLCAERGSAAQVCRDIGINQQQFSKYLTGRAKPSSHNLRRISRYFGVRDEDMFEAPEQLIHAYQKNSAKTGSRTDPFYDAFPGSLRDLRRFLGVYQTFNLSPAAPDGVVVALTMLEEHEGLVYSKTVDSMLMRSEDARQSTVYEGKAAYHGERLFVMEFESQNSGSFMMTTLFPPHRYRRKYLFGMVSFLASSPHRMPYSSRTVWERLDTATLPNITPDKCGEFPLHSSRIGPTIRDFLLDDSPVMPDFTSF
ncbi:helix-turn-helix transcriptional regulator [Oceanimonas sp. MB9]|uniref:helix-turn-helix transcriptional regulator n=1 Tax=Oceanimonas sp. MB9 TaxID=2588453 RepID=UPI0013F689A8|nr:helix-turn-helix transcriptional regulator [Oceanimonas sp. MB9]NHI01664.1 hypothetical protein [Oceanimonas sp. MB9]